MPFAPYAPVDLALKERIRVAYFVEDRTVAEVEDVAGVARATLYRWFDAWGWPRRRPMRSRARKPGERPAFRPGGAATDASRNSLKLRLKHLVEHRIGLLERDAMTGVAVDPDANARAIELNARTLVTIERLGEESEPCPTCCGAGPSRTLAELRDELYGHLLRVRREERESAGLPPDVDDGVGVPAGLSPPSSCL